MMAVFVLLGLSTYLRPASLLTLMGAALTRPVPGGSPFWSLLVHPMASGSSTKTFLKDVSMLLDTAYLNWCPPLWAALSEKLERRLFNFDYPTFCLAFNRATASLRLKAVPYQLRHSGPSIDRARGLRTLLDVQQRGTWKQAKSVLRYDKHALLAKAQRDMPADLVRLGLRCEEALAELFLRRRVI